jgi:hypothetical protein
MGIELLKIDYRNKNKYPAGTVNTFLSNIERSIIDERQVGDIFIAIFKDEIGIRDRC